MRKLVKISIAIIIAILIGMTTNVYAISETARLTEYTEEYKKYLDLSDEEKQKVLEPKPYNVIYNNDDSRVSGMRNVFGSIQLLSNSLDESYNLRDYIPNNVQVRDQASTNFCWAYATLASSESALGFLDYKNGRQGTVYDYSERHLAYGARRNAFLNNQINEYGATKDITSGGNFFDAQTYLSNGMGAIEEAEMPFENNMDNIDISEIQNKTTSTTLYDTIWFESLATAEKTEIMSKMKQHISTYGGIYAGVHGASLFSDAYNNTTGAMYCNSSETFAPDHAITIIGWDDNYSKDNFNETMRPNDNGAWIVKNSWGERISYELTEVKTQMYEANKDYFNSIGVNSPADITNEFIEEFYKPIYGQEKVTIDDENIVITVGNDGYMYISYEDANIYNSLSAVQKISATKDYDNIYQHDILGSGYSIYFTGQEKMYIANKFNREDANKTESLDKISLFTLQEIECEVFINPNSDDLSEVQKVELKSGDSIVLEPGYHVIELENPINLTGDSFAVAASLEGQGQVYIMIESPNFDENAEYNANESFYTDESSFLAGNWYDWNTTLNESLHGNVSLKAFTKNEAAPAELEKIEIRTAPNKVNYIEGESFSKEGMEVVATYSDLSKKIISDYEILNGDNLYTGQTSVTVSYTENGITKTVEQEIIVEAETTEKEITKIEISTLPTKLEYALNTTELDLTGGVIKVTYADGSTSNINMESSEVSITGFDSSNLGEQTITVNYRGFTTTFEIQVLGNREPILSSLENMQVKLDSFDVYVFSVIEEDDYLKINITVSNISQRDEDTKYTYYYYLAGNDQNQNIENWVEVNSEVVEQEDGTYSMSFTIDTRDLTNFDELEIAERGYLYIREVAELDGNTLEQTNVAEIEVEGTSARYFVDNEQLSSLDDITIPGIDDNFNSNLNDTTDNTIAGGKIPQTGVISIGIIILVIIGIGIISYIRYRNIDK